MLPIFSIKDGNLSFGHHIVLNNIELYVSPGDRICLIGRNGSGKSSLMKVIFGEYELDTGEIYKNPTINIGYLKQDMKNITNSTIYDFVLSTIDSPEENKYKAEILLENLQINGNNSLTNCSGGQIRRAFLAKALIEEPEILLLDEPTNHLDIIVIEWLETYINSYKGAIICISHDRAFLSNTTNKVWWIDRSILKTSNKGFRNYEDWKASVIAEEEAVLKSMNRKLQAEKDWLNTGVTARRKRNQKRLANLHRLREQLKSHQNKLNSAKARLAFDLIEESKRTKFILEAIDITYSFDGSEDIIKDFNIKIKKGEKIGIIGPNGSGKTTLIKLLTKSVEPIEGRVKHGTNIDVTYFDQHRSELNLDHTIQKILCPTGGDHIFLKNKTMHVAAYLKLFMFDPRQIHDKVSTLSGGQANRLLLAKALINPGNLLILDEPTNDLDMESLEILLDILAEYDGTLLVVSHDRDFLEKLVTRTLVFTNQGIIDLYGGYDDYLKYYKKDEKVRVEKIKEDSFTKPKAEKSKKLSYKYARLLDVLPGEIESLEKKIIAIEAELMDPAIYHNNRERFFKLTEELNNTKMILEDKIKLWLEVEEGNF